MRTRLSAKWGFFSAAVLIIQVGLALPAFGQAGQLTAFFEAHQETTRRGVNVIFTDYSTTDGTNPIVSRTWDFGDNTIVQDNGQPQNVTHAYQANGSYTVRLTVVDAAGATDDQLRTFYIQVMNPPFAEFYGRPPRIQDLAPPPDLIVVFEDWSDTTGYTVTSGVWDWGDNQTSPWTGAATMTHVYSTEGTFTVTLTLNLQGPTQPPPRTRPEYIRIGSAATAEIPACQITVEDKLPDTHALLPLNNWAPLFRIGLTWASEDEPAPRNLVYLEYEITPDAGAADRPYDTFAGPSQSDIYEFAMISEGGSPPGDGIMGDDDRVLYVWRATGSPIGSTDPGPPQRPLYYRMDFSGVSRGTGTLANPEYPLTSSQLGNGYFVAVRTTQHWFAGKTLGYKVHLAVAVDNGGSFPTNPDDGSPVDSYEPGFFEAPPVILDPGTAYSSSFSVYDVSGAPSEEFQGTFTNAWNWPIKILTPQPEFARPRWDVSASAYDFVLGETMQLRRLFAIETWTAVVGINVHATDQSVVELGNRHVDGNHPGDVDNVLVAALGPAYIPETNIVMRDIGADPLGPPGSGGFNPTEGLEFMTDAINTGGGDILVGSAFGRTFPFNGVWLWHDTDNNYRFDRPIPGMGSITTSDAPAVPNPYFLVDDLPMWGFDPSGSEYWQWVPFPPDGGDPWWRIMISTTNYAEEGGGRIEPTPDDGSKFTPPTVHFPDYFIVIHPDSGFADSSGEAGDGTGITLGADMKVTIEPRDAANPTQGGMLVSTQIPFESGQAWQSHPLWGQPPGHIEPWWPQRTQNMNNTKPIKSAVDVHDQVLTYESSSDWATWTDIFYAGDDNLGLPFGMSAFDFWKDPFGLLIGQFMDGYSVGVYSWFILVGSDLGGFIGADENHILQQPYESGPFYSLFDVPPDGPRSFWFPNPPAQPTRPGYLTWPLGNMAFNPSRQQLPVGEYPRERDWPDTQVKARKLYQHVEAKSRPTAMLGFNLCAANDPVVTMNNVLYLEQITVAFWGPDLNRDGVSDFTPSDLTPLDPEGLSGTSGVALFYDTGSGTFTDVFGADLPVELRGLEWRQFPEYVDIDGDQQADDLNGDGAVNQLDKAWVLRLRAKNTWRVPVEDASVAAFTAGAQIGRSVAGSGSSAQVVQPPAQSGVAGLVRLPGLAPANAPSMAKAELVADAAQSAQALADSLAHVPGQVPGVTINALYSKKQPVRVDADAARAEELATKQAVSAVSGRIAGDPDGAGNSGDDLFLAIRTSDTIGRFERFKAFVPSWLPERAVHDRTAGIQLSPQNVPALTAYDKHDTEEAPVQSFFEHDLLEANIAVNLKDLTGNDQILKNTSEPLAVLGIDVSTNRGSAGLAAGGLAGNGGQGAFTVPGANWIPGAYVGYWLVDGKYESFEIKANTGEMLTLLSGQPASGPWIIAKDPTFLEQLIVEIYNEPDSTRLNLFEDLMPLTIDQRTSGVALYRDNDSDPANENGVFDPDIDIPVPLDYAPYLIGQQGEPPNQVYFVFSSPGTDNVALQGYPSGLANQPRRRQIVPDTFGATATDPSAGPDFFVVLRASPIVSEDVRFRVGIVGWGPNTPTEPDPDTFPPPPAGQNGEFDIFSEFPWGARALGFITFFKDITNYDPLENSGYNWVRTSASKSQRTNPIEIRAPEILPSDVIITSLSHQTLPRAVPAQGITLIIRGSGFGLAPVVTINDTQLTVQTASDTAIGATIPGGTTLTEPVILTVTNTQNGHSGMWTDFALTDEDWADSPTITAISPERGTSSDFPVTIFGTRFSSPEVYFDLTKMPVVGEWSPTRIVVAFPPAGLSKTGELDVTVKNTDNGLFTTKLNGFVYDNFPIGGPLAFRPCFIATAAYGTPLEGHLATFRDFRDSVLLKSAFGASLVDLYYTLSPPVADGIADHPWLAVSVRAVLTPAAWAIERPRWFFIGVALIGAVAVATRRRRIASGFDI